MTDTVPLPVGTRVTVVAPCVWPEREGRVGTVVAPAADGTYPQPTKWEVLVSLDDDPFGRDWFCINRSGVTPLS